MTTYTVSGNIVDIFSRSIFKGRVSVKNGTISSIERSEDVPNQYVMPGLIDAHVHIESSMLVPSRFAEMVVPRGTICVVTDPHEIANVAGENGVRYMIADGKTVPFKFFFGAPSCVPATDFESSGAVLNSESVERLLKQDDIWFLSEMMNFPGVVYDDPEVHAKLEAAKKHNKPIDGHAPGLRGEQLKKYIQTGISTDHECAFLEEAEEKLRLGMTIQIREGSAARNFEALHLLYQKHADKLMLCTDDSHPDEILNNGHIDRLLRLGIQKKIELFDLLRSATLVPAQHYNLPVGLLRVGDPADFIVVENLENFKVLETHIDGQLVFHHQRGVLFKPEPVNAINLFREDSVCKEDLLCFMPDSASSVRVIEVQDGELLTSTYMWYPKCEENRQIFADLKEDVIKLVVVNRYRNERPVVGFVKGMGIMKGAIGSTVAHDSHNIIVAGVDDADITSVINTLIENKGGIVATDGKTIEILKLPVGGLMSLEKGDVVAGKYKKMDAYAKKLGSGLKAPFMTLSFLSLLVIPSLKLGDKGLFDVNTFSFVPLFE